MADIVLYDGVCGLCNRVTRFILDRDPGGHFRFASLQSGWTRDLLARHGQNPSIIDTFYVAIDPETPGERLLSRSDAAVYVLRVLGGGWGLLGGLLRLVPRFVRDPAYGVVVRNRYRVFGRFDTCVLPAPEDRQRFIAV